MHFHEARLRSRLAIHEYIFRKGSSAEGKHIRIMQMRIWSGSSTLECSGVHHRVKYAHELNFTEMCCDLWKSFMQIQGKVQ